MSTFRWFLIIVAFFTGQHLKVVDGISIVTPLCLLVPLVLAAAGGLTVDRGLALRFGLVVTASLGSCIAAGEAETLNSAALLLLLNAAFVLTRTTGTQLPSRLAHGFTPAFQAFMLLCVVLGAWQILPENEFHTIRDLLPDDWLLGGFNTSNRMEVLGTTLFRSNGFFFLEPSFFSQYVAIAILLNMAQGRNYIYIAMMSAGMLLSLSGTGFILLGVGLFAMALSSANPRQMAATLVPLVVLATATIYFLPSLAERVTELDDEDMSGYWRFVLPFVLVIHLYTDSLQSILFGVGPGVAKNAADTMLMAYSSGFGKMFYEFGALASIALIALHFKFCMVGYGPRWFSVTMIVFIYFVNCGIQQPPTLLTVIVLSMLWPVRGLLTANERPVVTRRVPRPCGDRASRLWAGNADRSLARASVQ